MEGHADRRELPRAQGRVPDRPSSPVNGTGTDPRGIQGCQTAHCAAHQPQGTWQALFSLWRLLDTSLPL